jgi:hypothetical protein
MTIIINELEQLPATTETRADTRRGSADDGTERGGSPAAPPPQVMTVIRREMSRLARLWAD